MNSDFFSQLQTLHQTGPPFVVVTFVRAEKSTSAKGIITQNDTLTGWIGGIPRK